MLAKEFLMKGYRSSELIESYKEEINSLLGVLSSPGFGDKVQSSPSSDGVAKLTEKIIELKAQRFEEISRLVEAQKSIGAVIEKVEDKDQKTLLRKRYINFHEWADIAEEMRYSERHIQRLHQKALFSVEIILANEPPAFSLK